MNRVLVMLGIVIAASACSNSNSPTSPSANQAKFTVNMLASSEVPPISGAEANAKGTAIITFDLGRDASGNLTSAASAFDVTLSGLPSTSVVNIAHIHPGRAGANGSVLVNTTLAPGQVTLSSAGAGQFTKTNINVPVDQAQSIMADPSAYYFNVHTAANPGGVMRGQLVRTQ
jgi:hypothetical protein